MTIFNNKGVRGLQTIVDGDTISESFFVDLPTAHTVMDLKGAIRDTMSRLDHFKQSSLLDVAMDKIQVWKVLFPPILATAAGLRNLGQEEVHLNNLKTKTKLGLTQMLEDVFQGDNTLAEGLVLVVVKCEF
ncbi:hypothetical protein BGX24_003701 [Mortierella sp. AD032]|nr:hypothetical protein BGX24_003701 [Mortierella sp. AD032]